MFGWADEIDPFSTENPVTAAGGPAAEDEEMLLLLPFPRFSHLLIVTKTELDCQLYRWSGYKRDGDRKQKNTSS